MMGPHEKCGLRLTCGLKRLLLPRAEYGEQVCLAVGTQLLLIWLHLHASSCRHHCTGMVNNNWPASLLQAHSRALKGKSHSHHTQHVGAIKRQTLQ
jgi:hypothetical protein